MRNCHWNLAIELRFGPLNLDKDDVYTIYCNCRKLSLLAVVVFKQGGSVACTEIRISHCEIQQCRCWHFVNIKTRNETNKPLYIQYWIKNMFEWVLQAVLISCLQYPLTDDVPSILWRNFEYNMCHCCYITSCFWRSIHLGVLPSLKPSLDSILTQKALDNSHKTALDCAVHGNFRLRMYSWVSTFPCSFRTKNSLFCLFFVEMSAVMMKLEYCLRTDWAIQCK